VAKVDTIFAACDKLTAEERAQLAVKILDTEAARAAFEQISLPPVKEEEEEEEEEPPKRPRKK